MVSILHTVLSHLICASLTEDPFGVVQRDIPRTLEAFLTFLDAIEEYHAELWVLPTPEHPLTESDIQEMEKAHEALSVVIDGKQCSFLVCLPCLIRLTTALKEGVIRIVRTL